VETKKVTIFNIPIDALTLEETVQEVDRAIREKKQIHHIAVNVAKVVNAQKDMELYESVISADIINSDGLPLVWVSKILGKPLPERVTGVDLMQRVTELAFKKKYKAYFFGASQEVVARVVEIYKNQFSTEMIGGFRNGYFKPEEENGIAREIADSGSDILFVAITSPKKEIFLHRHKETLKNVSFIMGVGGTFDVVAGKVKRAPRWMQKSGLEWFFRVLQEPRRMWKRYLITNTLFIFYVVREFFRPNSKLRNKQNVR
jgi:N-acetylglucosaminyldiphosphoundecaprenol N-acetyl-beta-D-mannosaminyltransferase